MRRDTDWPCAPPICKCFRVGDYANGPVLRMPVTWRRPVNSRWSVSIFIQTDKQTPCTGAPFGAASFAYACESFVGIGRRWRRYCAASINYNGRTASASSIWLRHRITQTHANVCRCAQMCKWRRAARPNKGKTASGSLAAIRLDADSIGLSALGRVLVRLIGRPISVWRHCLMVASPSFSVQSRFHLDQSRVNLQSINKLHTHSHVLTLPAALYRANLCKSTSWSIR